MDEERKIVTIEDDNGEKHDMESLDFVDYQENTYAIFTPYVEDEDLSEENDDEDVDVVVMSVIEEGENVALQAVTDQALAMQILEAFTEQVAMYELEEFEGDEDEE